MTTSDSVNLDADPFQEVQQETTDQPTPQTDVPEPPPTVLVPSTEDLADTQAETVAVEAPPAKKVFTRADVKRHITVEVCLPKLYPGYEPWAFDLRLKLSRDAEERRQEYLALAASQMTVKLKDQVLDEICDLLVAYPRGFSDLPDGSGNPGTAFRAYVESSDPVTKELLLQIVEGADNLYWSSITPREFQRTV